MAKRLMAMGQPNYKNGFKVTEHDHVLTAPLNWKKPRKIFVNSMSDMFHKDVSLAFIQSTFKVMQQASCHIFQVLTKRSGRMLQLNPRFDWPPNVWMGVSVETEKYLYRIDDLRKTGAKIKFLSLEPLLGPISNLNLSDIQWVIVGGESGPHARPMEEEWALDIRDQCMTENVPFFFKQWGGVNKKRSGRILDGRLWNALPNEVQI